MLVFFFGPEYNFVGRVFGAFFIQKKYARPNSGVSPTDIVGFV